MALLSCDIRLSVSWMESGLLAEKAGRLSYTPSGVGHWSQVHRRLSICLETDEVSFRAVKAR